MHLPLKPGPEKMEKMGENIAKMEKIIARMEKILVRMEKCLVKVEFFLYIPGRIGAATSRP